MKFICPHGGAVNKPLTLLWPCCRKDREAGGAAEHHSQIENPFFHTEKAAHSYSAKAHTESLASPKLTWYSCFVA